MRRADNPHIHRYFLATANSFDGSFLNKAKQFGLQGKGQVADLVKHQGAAVRRLNFAKRHLGSPCERPFLVAKQLTLQQIFRDCRAIDGHELACAPWGQLVQAACQYLLARAALTQQHDCRIAAGNFLNCAANTQHIRVARHQA